MCLILCAYNVHPRYPLIIAANRDEFYERPSAPVSYWEEDQNILAGKDLLGGGTWLGITKGGRFAALTNIRDPLVRREGGPSRGVLVRIFSMVTKVLNNLLLTFDRLRGHMPDLISSSVRSHHSSNFPIRGIFFGVLIRGFMV
jgi:uncharacterized protein with NRDE domain